MRKSLDFASDPFWGLFWGLFALLGRGSNVDIASLTVSKIAAMSEILQQLVSGGHNRIVLMTRDERRKPELGALEKHYLSELEALGIRTGPYNLPDWDNNPRSFHDTLASLFTYTPPTAILFDDPTLYLGALPFLTRQRIRIPEDLSVVVLDRHPSFAWADPKPTYIDTDPPKWVRTVMRWVEQVSRGKEDRRKTVLQAMIVEGMSVASAREA